MQTRRVRQPDVINDGESLVSLELKKPRRTEKAGPAQAVPGRAVLCLLVCQRA